MKKRLLILLSVCIVSCIPSGKLTSTGEHMDNSSEKHFMICIDGVSRTLDTNVCICDTFVVYDITKRKGHYIIDLIKQNHYYPVISCMSQSRQVGLGQKIRKGDYFVLTLIPIFEVDRMPGGFVHQIVINNTKLEMALSYSCNLYLCMDVDGKYFIGDSNYYIFHKVK